MNEQQQASRAVGGSRPEQARDASTLAEIQSLADLLINKVRCEGPQTTNDLRRCLTGKAGTEKQTATIRFLEDEDPPRLVATVKPVQKRKGGPQLAKVWSLPPAVSTDRSPR